MKKFNLIIALVCVFSFVRAQDTIKFTNGNIIAAKILEINTTTIKYKPLNNINGPDYIDEKYRISYIKYANGMVDTIKVTKEEKPVQISLESIPTLKALAPQFNRINQIENRYFFVDANNQKIGRGIGINKILKTANSLANEKKIQSLTDLAKKTNSNKKMQTVFGIVGAPVILVGLVTTFAGLAMSNSIYYNTGEKSSDADNMALVGATITTIGIGFEITSIINGINKKKRLKETIDLYNQNL